MEKYDGPLKDLERNAYRSTFEDGVYDLAFGIFFLILALLPVFEKIGVSRFAGYTLLIVPMIIPWVGKRFITIPRLGEVKFAPGRRKRSHVAGIIAGAIVILTLPLIIMMVGKTASSGLDWKLIVISLIPLFVLAMYAMDFPRLYVYAALLLFAVAETEFLLGLLGSPLNAVFSFGLPGLIISFIGVVLLVKFVRTYPHREVAVAE